MRNLFTLILVLGLSACGCSPGVLEDAYDNLGRQYATDLKQLATLTEEQEAGVDAFAAGLHRWHRRYRLPEYAGLASRLGDGLRRGEPIGDEELLTVVQTLALYPHFQEAKDSNRQLARLAETLSDGQLAQLAKSIDEEFRGQQEQLQALSEESLASKRVRYVNRIAEYLGVDLSREQLDLLRTRSASFHDQREAWIATTREWNEELIRLLGERHQSGFEQRFVAHMESDNAYVRLLRTSPDITRENDRLSVEMLRDLLASLSEEQRERLATNLSSMGDTLRGLAGAGE